MMDNDSATPYVKLARPEGDAQAIASPATPALQAEPCDRCATPRACAERGCAAVAAAKDQQAPSLTVGERTPLTLEEVRNLCSMQSGVPWPDHLEKALAECIQLYEQCAAADIRPFDPSDLTPQQHDAFWERGELPWHGPAAQPEPIRCPDRLKNGGNCPHHNLHCGWPKCNEVKP